MTNVNVCRLVRAGAGGVQLTPPPVATIVNVYDPATRGVPDKVMAEVSKVRPGGMRPVINVTVGVHMAPNHDVVNWKK